MSCCRHRAGAQRQTGFRKKRTGCNLVDLKVARSLYGGRIHQVNGSLLRAFLPSKLCLGFDQLCFTLSEPRLYSLHPISSSATNHPCLSSQALSSNISHNHFATWHHFLFYIIPQHYSELRTISNFFSAASVISSSFCFSAAPCRCSNRKYVCLYNRTHICWILAKVR